MKFTRTLSRPFAKSWISSESSCGTKSAGSAKPTWISCGLNLFRETRATAHSGECWIIMSKPSTARSARTRAPCSRGSTRTFFRFIVISIGWTGRLKRSSLRPARMFVRRESNRHSSREQGCEFHRARGRPEEFPHAVWPRYFRRPLQRW